MAIVEFCVALKDLYSIAISIPQAKGDQYGCGVSGLHNPAAAVYAQALVEMIFLKQCALARAGNL